MASTILQLAQDAAVDLGLNSGFTTLFAADDNGDTSNLKLRRALARTVQTLGGYDWQTLLRERVFKTVAGQNQTGVIPADFLRFVPDTMWDRTSTWKIQGPLTAQDWQNTKAWRQAAVVPYFRETGNTIEFYPVPAANRTIAFEYVSNTVGLTGSSVSATLTSTKDSATATTASTTGLSVGMRVDGPDFTPGTLILSLVTDTSVTLSNPALTGVTNGSYTAQIPVSRFLTDTDTTFWDDELIIQGIVFQYRKAERFDYAQDQADFELLKAERIKQDGGRRKVNMGGRGNSAQDRVDAMRSAAVVIRT